MPIYMDRHYIEGVTRHAVVDAHEMDLAIQHKYSLTFLTYWFDEERSTGFCLVESPDKETIQQAHNEAHGLVPHEIMEVDPAVIEAFLGRVKDPLPIESTGEIPIDKAFRTIMFTDLKDSTLMTTTHGDARALHLLHIHNLLIRDALRDYEGSEVKHTGDGFMVSFASVIHAVDCAAAIQQAFAQHNEQKQEESLFVRIGLSAGEPIEEHGDLFGSAVQLAARLCAHAEPTQILAAQVILEQCPGSESRFSDFGLINPKGFDEAIRVYQVEWQS